MDNLLPDVVGYVGARFSLWIAEEEPGGTGNLLKELVSKRNWCYKAIPYILGYYASGLAVTLVALYYEGGRVKSRHLATFNLYEIGDRVKLFMVMSNVGRVLGGLHDMCIINNENTEFEVVKGITTGKSVRLAGDQVIKGYLTKGKRMKVWKIYYALKGCPNMETCLSRKPRHENGPFKRRIGEYMLSFSPRLNRTARPSTQESLVRALLDVSEALAWLKEKRWIHRDVHWGNVALDEVAGVWTLIDVEEACTFEEATTAHPLNSRVHAPEMLTGYHGSPVDVWGLGHLIRSASNVPALNKMVDDVLWELSKKCSAVDPSDRPSIAECRVELESCRTLLSEDSMDCGTVEISRSDPQANVETM
ncbi:uncharacterized protein LOC112344878 [Selaginella moellendorffii]|uniref:uncharacterized protein LOC112344878 n=1 Tax=Selaginella moellendorffii TaxID=88036 RepID=UPI000D1C4142|nr:uncharacterized protein LOC112344878 [Selaginella moellendorffii]|eukprot:XP_024526185.1 uncharacterized protein LOC112344878 [Selaginella moellendorffii]